MKTRDKTKSEQTGRVLCETGSICPECLRRLDAKRVERDGDIYLEKTCPTHGAFRTVVWRGAESYAPWVGGFGPEAQASQLRADCPYGCGICEGHGQSTCCVLLEVTDRCDLGCVFCYAGGGRNAPDPPLDALLSRLDAFDGEEHKPFVYLTGGEPALRDDLPALVAGIRALGFPHVQLNTNGRRLAADPAFARTLADAGLSFVFLQFDGTTDEIYREIRGQALLDEKRRAIENCDAALLGVTLVPTLIPGVNVENIGDIIRFGIEHSPAVRGVHFQPVTYLGRYAGEGARPPDAARVTLPEVVRAIHEQMDGLVEEGDIVPSSCDHPLCGFHGDFMVLPDRTLEALTPKRPAEAACCCAAPTDVEKNRNFVARRWKRSEDTCCATVDAVADPTTLDGFLQRMKTHGFTITGMAFQDAYTLDLARLGACSLHVVGEDGGVAPFCAYYMTDANGARLFERREELR